MTLESDRRDQISKGIEVTIPPNTLKAYPALTSEARLTARQRAHETLIVKLGGEPQFAQYQQLEISDNSEGVNRTIFLGIWLALAAAFITSGFHVYNSARESYGAGITDPKQQIVAGFAFVILAEFLALLCSSLPGLLDVPPRLRVLLYILAALAVGVAIIGNVAASIQCRATAFDWFLKWWRSLAVDPMLWAVATVPPTAVLGLGTLEKHRILKNNQARHKAKIAYQHARADWQDKLDHLEEQPAWPQTYADELWDQYVAVNKRRKTFDVHAIPMGIRRALIDREMRLEQWFTVSPETLDEGVSPIGTGDGSVSAQTDQEANVQRAQVLKHLQQHPEDRDLSLRDLGEKLNVSHSTVRRALASTNGNGEHHDN